MIGFDITSLSATLLSTKPLEKGEQLVLIERMIETAVYAINNPFNHDSNIDRLVETLELEFGVINPAAQICEFREHIEREMAKHCWDPRLKIKMDIKRIGKVSCKAVISIDLEETVMSFIETPEPKEVISEIISDHPTLEQLDELIPTRKKRPARSVKVLPDLKSRFVVDPEGRNWNPRH